MESIDFDKVFSEGSFLVMLGTFHAMNPSQIKNIFWDVDGVLADLNYAYFHFLTGYPSAKPS